MAAGHSTVSREGYNLHEFPHDDALCIKWEQDVKCYQSNWYGASTSSVLCSQHFEPECYILEGIHYCNAMGIPAKR